MIKAAIYIRVSTQEQAQEGLSLAAQENLLRSYCKQTGYDVTNVYVDEGISAKDIKHRPRFLQMMTDAENGKFNVIVFWKLTRFSRSTLDLLQCCKRLEKCGVGLKSYSEPIDTTTAAGKMMITVLGAMAQFERDVTSENVKMVAKHRAEQGKRTCSYVLGYDLKGKDGLTVNPEESEIVKFIFDTFLKCHSLSETAEKCKCRGYRGKHGGKLKPWHIERILTCPIHAGFYSFCGKVYKGNFESIVSIDDYNLVQIIIENHYAKIGRTRKKELFILQ